MSDYEKQTIRHIMGTVGGDPERVTNADGSTFTKFSVAVTRDYDDDARPRWFGVVVNKEKLQRAVLDRIKKGSKVGCEGIPSTKQGDSQVFHNFKAFRVGLVEYIGLGQAQPASKPAQSASDDDDDWGDDL